MVDGGATLASHAPPVFMRAFDAEASAARTAIKVCRDRPSLAGKSLDAATNQPSRDATYIDGHLELFDAAADPSGANNPQACVQPGREAIQRQQVNSGPANPVSVD